MDFRNDAPRLLAVIDTVEGCRLPGGAGGHQIAGANGKFPLGVALAAQFRGTDAFEADADMDALAEPNQRRHVDRIAVNNTQNLGRYRPRDGFAGLYLIG